MKNSGKRFYCYNGITASSKYVVSHKIDWMIFNLSAITLFAFITEKLLFFKLVTYHTSGKHIKQSMAELMDFHVHSKI